MTGHSAPLDLKRLTDVMTDAFNRRDLDGVMAMYSQSPVWDTSAVGLGIHEGRKAVRAFHEDWQRAYEDFEGVVEDLEAVGNGVAITVFYQRARPKGGSGLVELRFALVMTWADGLVEQVTAYIDIDEARAAAERLACERGWIVPGEDVQCSDAEARLRAWFDGFNKTQEPQLLALHPEIHWHLRADLPESRALIGHEGVRQLNADWSEVFEDLCLEPVDVIDVAGKTVATIRFHARHKPTGHALDMEEAWVIGWRNLQIIEIREYNTREQALGSLGLGE